MPKEFSRTDRVADALQRELAQLIRDEMNDPRLGIVNITVVEVSRDLSQAKVYLNFVVPKDEADAAAAIEVLNGSAGFLRAQAAKSIRMRSIPKLRFYYDASGERGQKLSALIDLAVSQDRSRQGEDD
ncbi:MAG: 30S ribosome-binding factor RbfA [Porticoccaceae bacterium]|jgi:ribosome-binding factor A